MQDMNIPPIDRRVSPLYQDGIEGCVRISSLKKDSRQAGMTNKIGGVF
jgi:hypothetical protein